MKMFTLFQILTAIFFLSGIGGLIKLRSLAKAAGYPVNILVKHENPWPYIDKMIQSEESDKNKRKLIFLKRLTLVSALGIILCFCAMILTLE